MVWRKEAKHVHTKARETIGLIIETCRNYLLSIINEPWLKADDNRLSHFGMSLPVSRDAHPSPAEQEFPGQGTKCLELSQFRNN